jgi:hypothetical protein
MIVIQKIPLREIIKKILNNRKIYDWKWFIYQLENNLLIILFLLIINWEKYD